MDESHRLKQMPDNYDLAVFEKIYKETAALRHKLAFKIDNRRFGVDKQEIIQWFDIKFIHAFCQFHEKYDASNIGNLKGYIINALTTYQYRVMAMAYKQEFANHHTQLDITELTDETEIISNPEYDTKNDTLLEKAMDYLKSILSEDAYTVLQVELQRPQWIVDYMEDRGCKPNASIPNNIIADYLGFPKGQAYIQYVGELRKEIKRGISLSAEYFS